MREMKSDKILKDVIIKDGYGSKVTVQLQFHNK